MLVERNRVRKIFAIGLPIIGGNMSGVLLGLIDTAMVGTLGNEALAAVGISTFASFIYLGLFFGFSIAVQATASRRKGEGREKDSGHYLNSALIIILLFAPASSVLLYLLVPFLFPFLNPDPQVIELGVAYIRWLILQATFVGFINACNGFWNGIGLSRIYMPSMILMHVTNVVFNYIFIFGKLGAPKMGVEGAGFATALAALTGSIFYLRLGFKYGRPYGFLVKRPTRQETRSVLKLAIPAGLQQVMDIAALTFIYTIVGLIGTMEVASYTVLINLINLTGLPAWGLGSAGASLVGQALGEKSVAEASRWAWDVIKLGMLAMAILGAPLWIFPDPILSIWIHDPSTLDLARTPTRILGLMITFNGVGYMLAMMLNGAGDVKKVTYVNFITQWFWLVPCAYLIGPYLGYGLLGIWCLHQFGFRALQSIIYVWFWHRGGWAKIKI